MGIRKAGRLALAASLVFALAGCGGGGGGTTVPGTTGGGGGGTTTTTVTLTSISISPSNPAALPAGLTQQFTATGYYSNGTSAPLTSVNWSSSNTSAATIGSSGLAKGVAPGSTYIGASVGTVSAPTVFLYVTSAVVTSVSVTPATATVGIGQPIQFTATATYSDSTTADATSSAGWSTSNSAVATIGMTPNVPLGIAGMVTGAGAGTATITTTFGGYSGTAGVTVTSTYAVDGTLSGLPAGDSVTIADNGTDTLALANSGTTATSRYPFFFGTTLSPGAAYNVTVATQPAAPAHPCTVVDGKGILDATYPVVIFWPQVVCGPAVGTIAGFFHYGSINVYGGYVNNTDPTLAQFNWPTALAFDTKTAGNLYVADSNNNAIRLVAANGAVSTYAGPAPAPTTTPSPTTTGFVGTAGTAGYANSTTASSALFNHPMGLAVDASGNVYVGDMNNNVIRMVTPAGAVSTLAGASDTTTGGAPAPTGFSTGTTTLAAAQFNAPGAVAMDGNGNIYVLDTGNYAIRKIVPSGASAGVSTLAGNGFAGYVDATGTAAQFNNLSAIVVDPTNTYLYVADNCVIRQVVIAAGATYGQVTTLSGSTTGSYSCGYQDGATATALYLGISGLALDSSGNLYVGDFVNDVIRKITPGGSPASLANGTVSTVAGNATTYLGSFADGPAASAAFDLTAKGFAIDPPSNKLIFSDSANNVIRKFTP